MAQDKRKLKALIIVNYFPPNSGGGRAYRIAKMVKYLSLQGCEVVVFCSSESADPDDTLLSGADESNVRVIRCAYSNSRLGKILRRIAKSFFIADGQYWLAWNLLDAVLKNQIGFVPDVVITSSAPYEVHITGLFIKKLFRIKWVSDFRDPYTLNINYRKLNFIGRLSDRIFENSIYKKSDLVIFNTESNLKESADRFGLNIEDQKYTVCQNGFDPDDMRFTNSEYLSDKFKKRFVFSYIGGVRGSGFEKIFVRRILENVSYLKENNIVFRFIGNGGHVFKQQAGQSDGVIEIIDFCSQKELASRFKESDALFLMLPESDRYLGWVPQKIYSYLGYRKLIVAYVPEGEARDYIRQSGNHILRYPNDDDLKGIIEEFMKKKDDVQINEDYVSQFDQNILFGRLLDTMEGIARA